MTGADYPIALPPRHGLHEYRIERVLGHGGFGITYLATDTALRKKVAIKEYLPAQFAVRTDGATVKPRTRRLADDYRWGLERFLEEARTLARFRHPSIVPVLRFFEAHGTAYIVMEHEEGRPLADLLMRPGRLPPGRVRALLDGIMNGLERIHAAGFLHRDIKPSNIIVRSDGSPVLIDFGAARQALLRSGATLTSIVTPRYAPLEQYQADTEQGPWTDIYALAAVTYHAITGDPPPEAVARVRKDPCRILAGSHVAGYGQTFLAAVDRGLAVHAEERPRTISDWRAAMGPPPADAREADVAPAAARTRVMQSPLTVTAGPPGGDHSRRLGGVDASVRIRPAAAPRLGLSGMALWLVVLAMLGAGAVYAWQAYLDTPRGGQTAAVQPRPAPPAAPPPVAVPPSTPKAEGLPPVPEVRPSGRDPVPLKPGSSEPPGKVGSIDELLNKEGVTPPPPESSVPANIAAAREKAMQAAASAATQARAAAESAERARQRALERAGDARIRAAEAGKSDLPGVERVTFDDGSVYAGQIADGHRGGLGVAEFGGGERQAGEWKEDRLSGLGVLRASDSRGYEGEWRDGTPDGLGVFRLSADERHYGAVKDGQPNGAGVRVLGDGNDTIVRAGTWRNGALEGPGVETSSGGWRYEGMFRGGRRHGPGTLTAPDGVRFHGTFVDGVADGYGVAVMPDGRVSSGEWRAGKVARAED
jgi:serine/threonine protein kinase